MFKSIREFIFLIKVQAEIKAQTGNQEIVDRLCENPEVVDVIRQFNEILRTNNGYNAKVAAFMTLFPVYAFALTRGTYSLEEKIKFATWLNDANAKAVRNINFYNNYLEIFLSAQSKMHEFCIENNLNPDELISNK